MKALFLLLLPVMLFAEEWTSDSDGSLDFAVGFEGESLPGEFTDFNVTYAGQALNVTVRVKASDMGDEEMNTILHDPVWLAVDDFGVARYTSTDVTCDEQGACVAVGELQLKGTTRQLVVPFSWQPAGDVATLRGELMLDRNDFDVGSGEWSTAEFFELDVKIRFDIRLRRSP